MEAILDEGVGKLSIIENFDKTISNQEQSMYKNGVMRGQCPRITFIYIILQLNHFGKSRDSDFIR
jgi:hypothetical protein